MSCVEVDCGYGRGRNSDEGIREIRFLGRRLAHATCGCWNGQIAHDALDSLSLTPKGTSTRIWSTSRIAQKVTRESGHFNWARRCSVGGVLWVSASRLAMSCAQVSGSHHGRRKHFRRQSSRKISMRYALLRWPGEEQQGTAQAVTSGLSMLGLKAAASSQPLCQIHRQPLS